MSLSGYSQSAFAGLDSSDDEESANTQTPSVSSRAQPGLEEALRTAQLQLDVEKTRNQELKEKNMVLDANKPQHSKKNILPELLAYDSKIQMLVKKYGVTTELFFPCTLTTNVISQPSPVSVPSFSTTDHYATALTEEFCLVAELDAILPDHLCHVQNLNSFHDLFTQGMQSGAEQIFGLLKANLIPNFPCLEVPEIVKMLGVKDVGTILKAALWGKALLAKGFMQCSGPKTNGRKWQVTAVMPGSIAGAATICMFLLSPDTEFLGNGIGHMSKVDYYNVFCAYKCILIVKWTDTHIQRVISEMNAFIFGKLGMVSAQSATGVIEDLLAEIDAAALTSEDNNDNELTDIGPPADPFPNPPPTTTPPPNDNLTTLPHCTADRPPINNATESISTNAPKSCRGRGSRHRQVK
ncbi:hypothetical protein F5J12DRAFT_783764 [Pisolithus orientalis]|uniref:uncharacterized protein n=1 Tax=Pisolithus orientalis TaxID=936130 RepID=UPI0022253F6A|nr:uncharacterized protein F5J12DRAFT_783764 [Pisolithus orientalis]KAI6002592.1 hypothetical protein F5J12DRAFT_783764 [Pisolithus orientalis]